MAERPTLYLLDAYSLIYQVFHAIPLMTGPSGQPTNAVFGAFRDILNLRKARRPDYLAVALDGGGPVERSLIDANYKANRGPMPEDLRPQIPMIIRAYEGFGIPAILHEGWEADDIIATLARQGAARGLDVYICTADKDARQLITDQIRIFNVRKGEVLDAEKLKADWGIAPEQVVDLLALTGDSVDNVPGIPGIGIKTASALLQQFGTLDQILGNVDKVSGAKRKESLREHADVARQARRLVELNCNLELNIDWERIKAQPPDIRALEKLCIECGFHRFREELADEDDVAEPEWVHDYRAVDTPKALAEFADALRKQPSFCLDSETTGLDPWHADLVGLSFSWEEGTGWYLPVKAPAGEKTLSIGEIAAAIGPILADPAIEKVGQNLKYDLQSLRKAGLEVAGPLTDTMLLSYLLESGERNHNLNELSKRLLKHTMIPIEDLIGKGKAQITMDQVPVVKVTEYAAEDTDAAWRLANILAPEVREAGLWGLYEELERPLIPILARMEEAGIAIDGDRLRAISAEFSGRLAILEGKIHELAGREFNINSTPQLRDILYKELKLPIRGRTPKGEPSTEQEVLEELALKHELPRLLIEHRQIEKLKNTYLDPLPGLADAEGRLHAKFHQAVAATGRLSSSEPNLQNIPVRTEEGRQIRQAFRAGASDRSLLSADYSQIELRVLAHYSKDPALIRAFAEDKDIHAEVASRIFGVMAPLVTDEQRRMAKTVNFGVIYGLSPFGLSGRLGITQAEAEAFIRAYFDEYAGVESFITRTLEQAKADGYVATIRGRRRAISGIKNTTGLNRNLAERTAVNTVIQGSAADLIKSAMIRVDERLRASGLSARLLLQIHDELVFEAPDSELKPLAALVREAMTGALALDVPIGVNIEVGKNWLDTQPLDPEG